MTAPLLWHYTVGQWLRLILRDGLIRPATAFLPPDEKPVVWFSRNPDWEPTANKIRGNSDGSVVCLDMHGTAELGEGLARIGVAPQVAPYNWHQLKKLAGTKSAMARALEEAAIRQGSSPRDWYGTFDPVPREKWLSIEVRRSADDPWTPWAGSPGEPGNSR
jgi:hypothetical protein